LRDVVDISRDYESPAQFKNYFAYKTADGQWRRSRAITVAIQMRAGEQIRDFGQAIDQVLEGMRSQLPPDYDSSRGHPTSPKQVSRAHRRLHEQPLRGGRAGGRRRP